MYTRRVFLPIPRYAASRPQLCLGSQYSCVPTGGDAPDSDHEAFPVRASCTHLPSILGGLGQSVHGAPGGSTVWDGDAGSRPGVDRTPRAQASCSRRWAARQEHASAAPPPPGR